MKHTIGMVLAIILFHWIIPLLVLIAIVWAFLAAIVANMPKPQLHTPEPDQAKVS
jgi:cytochrome b561